MQPQVRIIKPFLMDDGTEPALKVDKMYEVNCHFQYTDGTKAISVLNEDHEVHHWELDEWFNEHFQVIGDLDEVWEEI